MEQPGRVPPVSQHEVSISPPQLGTAMTVSNSLSQVSTSSPQLDSATTLSMASNAGSWR